MATQPFHYNSCYATALEQQHQAGTLRQIPAPLPTGWIDFTSNDYLGLSRHPVVMEAAQNALQEYGCGSTGSRLLSGNCSLYEEAEIKFADYFGCQQALLLNNGFQANSTILPALLSRKTLGATPLVLSDKLIHASLQQGLALCRRDIQHYRFYHNNMQHLADLLQQHQQPNQPTFIITESLFSMDGDYAPLRQLITLKKQHNTFLYLDTAHTIGLQAMHHLKNIDLILGTFGKALGGYGAVIGGHSMLINYLVNTCKGLLYSTALSPVNVAAAAKALEISQQQPALSATLAATAMWFREEIQHLGFNTGNSESHIIPVILGNPEAAKIAADTMARHHIRCLPINPPTVQKGQSRLRFIVRADHTRKDLEKALIALREVASG